MNPSEISGLRVCDADASNLSIILRADWVIWISNHIAFESETSFHTARNSAGSTKAFDRDDNPYRTIFRLEETAKL